MLVAPRARKMGDTKRINLLVRQHSQDRATKREVWIYLFHNSSAANAKETGDYENRLKLRKLLYFFGHNAATERMKKNVLSS